MKVKQRSLQRLDIITLFPSMFEGPMTQSLLGRARERGLVELKLHNLRDYSSDPKHHAVDDRPYGGGAGMVLQAQPIFDALKAVRAEGIKVLGRRAKPWSIYLSPQGRVLKQDVAQALALRPWLILLCGHYEGVDERIMRFIDEEISIGDYVLTGGELPAMVVAEAAMRWVPGVVKESDSLNADSFQNGLLDYPHYTRPARWRGVAVPPVLLSGNHAAIRKWRSEQAALATEFKRPDLWRKPAAIDGKSRPRKSTRSTS